MHEKKRNRKNTVTGRGKCISPLRNTSFFKLPAVNHDLFGLSMSDLRLKSLYIAVEDGRGKLCLTPGPCNDLAHGSKHRKMVGRETTYG